MWSIPFALISGNAVVLKPSERTPSIAQILSECCYCAGIPAGVFSVINGGPSVVKELLAQPAIQAVNFVGSEITGEAVYQHAKATGKRVQAECSGKNHGVLMDDANKMKTLYAISGSAFGAAGQRCMALSVAVFVGETREWIDELVSISKSLMVGCGRDPKVKVGPLISRAAKAKVEGMITAAEAEGAKVLLDGRNYHVADYPDGNFVGPTILSDVQPYMSCYQDEIFGPVLSCIEVDTLEEAVELINNHRCKSLGPCTAQVCAG